MTPTVRTAIRNVPTKYEVKHEYAVERIVRHVGSGNNTRYVVLWYRYGPEADTGEPQEHITPHFILRYCNKKRGRRERR